MKEAWFYNVHFHVKISNGHFINYEYKWSYIQSWKIVELIAENSNIQ